MKLFNAVVPVAVLIAVVSLSHPACAQVVLYDTLDPAMKLTGGYDVVGMTASNIGEQDVAVAFTPQINARLNEIFVPLAGRGTFNVALMTDDADKPGAVLETFFINSVPLIALTVTPTKLTSVTQPLLMVDTQYWIAAFPGSPTVDAVWQTGIQGDPRQGVGSVNGALTNFQWFTFHGTIAAVATVRITGTPASSTVPEPSTFAFVFGGALTGMAFAASRMRGRKSR